MKNVLHDWDDRQACEVLVNYRRAVPADGVLLLVEWGLSDATSIDRKLTDLAMLVLTVERNALPPNAVDYRRKGGFQPDKVVQQRSNS